jgi:hypothetical protein
MVNMTWIILTMQPRLMKINSSAARSMTLALGIFLPEYLLYRYDHDDQTEEGGE